MGSIYLDNQSRNWKIKLNLNGADKRILLRRATDDEVLAWKKNEVRVRPRDVIDLARRHGYNQIVVTKGDPPAAQPDDFLGFMGWFQAEHAKLRRRNTVLSVANILKHFKRFLDAKGA